MSNYLYVVSDGMFASRIRSWILDKGKRAELAERTLPSGQSVFLVARSAENNTKNPANVLLGWAVDFQKRKLFFEYSLEISQCEARLEGCYLLARHRGDEITLTNDAFGQVQMLHFNALGVTAVSDSLFMLTELRRLLNLRCTVNYTDAKARIWGNSIASQIISNRTFINGISYSPPGTSLKVDVAQKRPVLSVHYTPAASLFGSAADAGDYRYELRKGAGRMVDFISTLIDLSDHHVNVDLSGGLDSRTALAAAHAADAGRDKIAPISNKVRQSEYFIAQDAALAIGKELGAKSVQYEKEKVDRSSQWFTACAGIYDPLHSPGVRNISPINFGIGGHGAEVYKGNYGWRSAALIARNCKSGFSEEFLHEMERGLKVIGIDPDHKWGSEWHYLGYRNSIHSGRSAMSSYLRFRPLLNKALVAASFADSNPWPSPGKEEPSLVTDLLIAFNPTLAILPFDDPRKNLSKSFVEERHRAIGKLSFKGPFDVLGRAENVVNGTPALFSNLAISKGLGGSLTAARVRKLAKQGWDTIPESLKAAHRELLDLSQKVADPVLASERASVSAGKLMKFLLADHG